MTREFVSQRREAVKNAVQSQGFTGLIEKGSKKELHMRIQANILDTVSSLQLKNDPEKEKKTVSFSKFSDFFFWLSSLFKSYFS